MNWRQKVLIIAAVIAAISAVAPAASSAAARPAKIPAAQTTHWRRVIRPLSEMHVSGPHHSSKPFSEALTTDPFADNWVNDNSQKCLDVTDNSSANGTQMQQWSCIGDQSQTFFSGQFILNGVEYPWQQIIHCVGSTCKCVEVYNWSKSPGAKVDTWSCLLQPNGLPDANQAWVEAGGPVGYTVLENENSDMAMDVAGAGTANGDHVIQYPINGGNNQYWQPTL